VVFQALPLLLVVVCNLPCRHVAEAAALPLVLLSRVKLLLLRGRAVVWDIIVGNCAAERTLGSVLVRSWRVGTRDVYGH